MKTNGKVIGTVYKEALGVPELDDVLTALGVQPDQILIMRKEARDHGHDHFETKNSDAVMYVHANHVALMLRGIRAEVVYDDQFEVGDTVKFKSGGPVMTVCKINQQTGNSPLPTVDTLWGLDGQWRPGHASKIPHRCLVPAEAQP
mgnify:CR=1 FL=1